MTNADGVSAFGANGTPSPSKIAAALQYGQFDRGRLLDAHVADRFCDRLREAAARLDATTLTSTASERAEAYYYLLSMIEFSVDQVAMTADPLRPIFSSPHRTLFVDWGAASPDGVYRRSAVHSDHAYRVSGRLGNADYFTIDYRTSPRPFAIAPEDIELDDDGTFELFLGGEQRGRNWWPLPEGTSGLLVRQFFADWCRAVKAVLHIDCLDADDAMPPAHDPDRIAAQFDAIGDWLCDGAVRFWVDVSERTDRELKNVFRNQLARIDTKLPIHTYGSWDLAPDEALVIELPDPHARFWSLQLASSQWRTLDYANRLSTFNCAQAHVGADGIIRFVLSHRDPGVHNWLDTAGLERGIMILRLHQAMSFGQPNTEVVPHDGVAARCAGMRACSPPQRREQLVERRAGVVHLHFDN